MRILIDLQHPAHLHFFRNLASRLTAEGHVVKFTGREKDILVELADQYGIDVEVFGVARPGMKALAGEWYHRQRRLWKLISTFRPDVMMAIAGTYVSSLGRLRRIPTYVFYDTEHATLSNWMAYPFATCVYVPRAYHSEIRWTHERYNGYHELAYLHPDYFTPDPGVRAEAGLGPEERFILIRFVGWGAAHDVGHQGLTVDQKMRIVEELSAFARPVLSAEGPLPESLEPLRLHLPVHRIHHLMAEAELIFGESATMPSEAALMGVPSVYVNPLRLGYLEEQERDYGIVSVFTPDRVDEAIARAKEILGDYDRANWRTVGQRIVDEKIDVTELLHEIALTRPHSRFARYTPDGPPDRRD